MRRVAKIKPGDTVKLPDGRVGRVIDYDHLVKSVLYIEFKILEAVNIDKIKIKKLKG